MESYIFYFFIYAFIGWVLEVSFHVITLGKFVNRGFLNGPYCPIYGFGALGVILFLTDLGKTSKLGLFFASMAIATILELVTGFLLEKIFHKRWWDYRDMKLNIGGYICAEFSLIWGAVCFILYEAIHPMIARMVGFIPRKVIVGSNIVLALVFIVDIVATVITILGLNNKFKALSKQSQEIKKISDDIGKRVADRTFEAIDKKREIENTRFVKDFDKRSAEFKEKFSKFGEKRILRAYPNIIEDLEDRWAILDINNKRDKKADEQKEGL